MLLLSVVAVTVSRRYPPDVIQGEAVAMRADVRHCNSSHSVHWSDDPPQEVHALSQDFLRNAQASNILQSNLVIGLLKPFNSPFT